MSTEKDKAGTGVQINVPGEAIDKAAAELIDKLAVKTSEGTVALAGDVFGGTFGDGVKQWRQRNLFDSLAKTATHLKERGVSLEDVRQLPMGDMYAVFYGASQEDEPEVQKLWAGLLANALDPSNATGAEKQFASILTNLSSDEALILDIIWEAQLLESEKSANKMKAFERTGDETIQEDLEVVRALGIRDDELRERFDNIEEDRAAIALGMMLQKGLIFYSGNYLDEVRPEDYAMSVELTSSQGYAVPSDLIALINSIADNINRMNNSGGIERDWRLFDRKNSFGYLFYDLSTIGMKLLKACRTQ